MTAKEYENFERMRKAAYNGRYLFGHAESILRTAKEWFEGFKLEAREHGARVEIENDYVYVIFEEDEIDA